MRNKESKEEEGVMLSAVKVDDAFAARVLGIRARESHKGDFGYIGLIGGSREYGGAVKLANLAATAMRSGAGVVRLIVPEGIAPAVAPYLMESTLYTLADDGSGRVKYDAERVEGALKGLRAVGAGMGLGRSPEVLVLVKHVLSAEGLRVVLDADALNVIAEAGAEILKSARGETVITPHPGEFARLTGRKIADIISGGEELASEFAEKYGVTVLLKGADTVITDGKRLFIFYTASANWTPYSCIGLLCADSGSDLLDPMSWKKSANEKSAAIKKEKHGRKTNRQPA